MVDPTATHQAHRSRKNRKAAADHRGALTTLSIANDVAKYFAIIPALFTGTYPALAALNIMGLHNPQSAILAAVIFNALIIIALVPLPCGGGLPTAGAPACCAESADLRSRGVLAPSPASGSSTGSHYAAPCLTGGRM